jgi:hypothetical protein
LFIRNHPGAAVGPRANPIPEIKQEQHLSSRRRFEQDPASQGGRRGHNRRRRKEPDNGLDNALEQGLEDSFPASDPVAVIQPPHSVYDKNNAMEV